MGWINDVIKPLEFPSRLQDGSFGLVRRMIYIKKKRFTVKVQCFVNSHVSYCCLQCQAQELLWYDEERLVGNLYLLICISISSQPLARRLEPITAGATSEFSIHPVLSSTVTNTCERLIRSSNQLNCNFSSNNIWIWLVVNQWRSKTLSNNLCRIQMRLISSKKHVNDYPKNYRFFDSS